MIADNEALGPRIFMSFAGDPTKFSEDGGLTLEKLLAAKAILDAACEPIDPDEPWTDEELGLK